MQQFLSKGKGFKTDYLSSETYIYNDRSIKLQYEVKLLHFTLPIHFFCAQLAIQLLIRLKDNCKNDWLDRENGDFYVIYFHDLHFFWKKEEWLESSDDRLVGSSV